MIDNSFTMDRTDLTDLAQQVLGLAAAKGATAAESDVSEGHGQSVTVRNGEIETIEYNRDKALSVTVYIGQRKGSASTSNFSAASIEDVVTKAVSLAQHAAEDPFAGLADPDLMPIGETLPDFDLFHSWELSTEKAVELANEGESAAFATDPRVQNSEGATVSTQQSQFITANSLGFCNGFQSSRHSLSCHVIAGKGDGMQRDGWYAVARDSDDLPAVATIGEIAAKRACARLNAKRIPTGNVPVLFEAPVAIGLLGHFTVAASGGSLYRKSSFLENKLGQRIFPKGVSIIERPHLLKGLASTPFDSDGVRTRDRDIVTDGFLQGYFLGVYAARKLGMETTGNGGGSHNLMLNPTTDKDFDALIKQMNRGLIVTELLGQGVNYVTGNYSRGACGFWVENGEIQFPVEEITIAGNLNDMFLSIVDVGNDVLVRGGKRSGSILIESMTVAGE